MELSKINKLEKKEFKLPHTFVILFTFIFVVSVMTYIIPAGVYEKVTNADGILVLDPTSYHVISKSPTTVMQFLSAIPQGFVDAGWIIALTFCVGAGFSVIQRVGTIPAAVQFLAEKFNKNGILVIPILMLAFSLCDSFIGMAELTIIYLPIIMPLMLGLGFDSITAAAVALCGSAAGFATALTNPFTVAIGHKISGLPMYSGWEFRIVIYTVMLGASVTYIMKYANKIKKNPKLSSMYEEDLIKRKKLLETSTNKKLVLNKRQVYASIYTLIMVVVMLAGVMVYKWDLPEMSAMFLSIGIGAGIIAGLSGDDLCNTLLNGCKDMLLGAVIIGIARGISVVMTNGQIIDTIVNTLSGMLQTMPGALTAIGMLLVVTLLNFLIPSGSGKAVVLFPILAPLADVVGITRQTAVLAYQFGDGFSNILYPTSGYFMAVISIAGISWNKWVKFYTPLFLICTGIGACFLVIAQIINYGPF